MDKKSFQKFVSEKIEKIMREGIRVNTRRPVSASNPRRRVSLKMAEAVAINMAKKRFGKIKGRRRR